MLLISSRVYAKPVAPATAKGKLRVHSFEFIWQPPLVSAPFTSHIIRRRLSTAVDSLSPSSLYRRRLSIAVASLRRRLSTAVVSLPPSPLAAQVSSVKTLLVMTESYTIQWPTGLSSKDIVAWGNSGLVCLDAASNTVIKFARGHELCKPHVEVERRIYERFQQNGGHGGVLQYYGPYESGIRLEYAPNLDLLYFLNKQQEIETQQRFSWAQQITDGLCFVHASNVIHGDLNANNIFITDTLDAKIGDFGGSSIDGSGLLVVANASHCTPQYGDDVALVQYDLFALGSVLYTIMTGRFPYQDLMVAEKAREIEALYAAGNFPETYSLGSIGAIITKCWQAKYDSAVNVRNDIEGMNTINIEHIPCTL